MSRMVFERATFAFFRSIRRIRKPPNNDTQRTKSSRRNTVVLFMAFKSARRYTAPHIKNREVCYVSSAHPDLVFCHASFCAECWQSSSHVKSKHGSHSPAGRKPPRIPTQKFRE